MATVIDRPRSTVTVRRLKPRIGAEIGGVDLRHPLSDEARDQIYDALLKHRVIFFHDQDLTQEQHLAFASRFAPIHISSNPMQEEDTPIFPVTSDGKVTGVPAIWHTDNSFHPEPPMASILRSRVIPSIGGDTAFSSAVAAYEGLDAETKVRIENLKAFHGGAGRRRGAPSPMAMASPERPGRSPLLAAKAKAIQERFPGLAQPVVRMLETGERALYVNELFTRYIEGLEDDESDALLRHLFAQFKIPENQYHFSWRVNSIAFWDNRAVQHYAVNDYNEPRFMERVTIRGDRPRGPADAD